MLSQIPNLACFALFLLSGIAQGQLTYDGYSTTALIPWADGHKNFDEVPHARIRITTLDGLWNSPSSTGYWKFSVDTGTCGILTTEEKSGITTTEKVAANRGWQYLSSSHVLYAGYWVERYVTFTESTSGSVSTPVQAKVKILSVHKKYEDCENWIEDDEDECNDPRGHETADNTISVLGIGYGRTYDGQPQGTPDKNPLLNLVNIGTSGLSTGFHPGWRIDEEGIKVGLTNTVWGGMSSSELHLAPISGMPVPSPSTAGINPHYPWPEVRGCVGFPTVLRFPSVLRCLSVALLLDTGIDWSSIRVDMDTARAVRISDTDHRLRNGQIAKILVGGPSIVPQVLAGFKYGPASPPTDCDVTPQRTEVTFDSAKRNFVNTGRHMFRRWAQGYDPWRGVVAFEEHRLISTRCAA